MFASVGAAGRALGLSEHGMVSALAMAGIYTPVPSDYKWIGDDGLNPRKEIEHRWAWMGITGAFAAVSARGGLKALQGNNILDGDRGLWRMLGMDQFDEARITQNPGVRFYIDDFGSKAYPGCALTFAALKGALSTVSGGVTPSGVERIDVATNWSNATSFDDQVAEGIADEQFNFPYLLAAAIAIGEKGPNWYTAAAAANSELVSLEQRVHVSFDDVVGREQAESILATIEELDRHDSLEPRLESLGPVPVGRRT